jgi:hypothetical protein
MNCLSTEQLVVLALGGLSGGPPAEEAAGREHLRHCPACAAALASVAEGLGRVAGAQGWFERGHFEARRRLLAALESVEAEQRVRPWAVCCRALQEVITMRRLLVSTAAVAVVMGLLLAWTAFQPPPALAQTAKALHEVKSYRCRQAAVAASPEKEDEETPVCYWYWAAPGSYGVEEYLGGKLVTVSVARRDKPGLEIDHKYETYRRVEPLRGPGTPVLVFMELAGFSGMADKELPKRKVHGKTVSGFEIATRHIDPDFGDRILRVWPDPETKLPLLVELEEPGLFTMVFDDFAWDVPADKWFDTTPPEKYKDETPTPMPPEEETKHVVEGLKTYAKYCDGKYPQAKMVYGDVTSKKLFQAAGLSDPHKVPPDEELKSDKHVECGRASLGYAVMNGILQYNPAAAYYGKTVGPEDKDKVLFRWQRPDGDYQVIFGDLRADAVTTEKLKALEKR